MIITYKTVKEKTRTFRTHALPLLENGHGVADNIFRRRGTGRDPDGRGVAEAARGDEGAERRNVRDEFRMGALGSRDIDEAVRVGAAWRTEDDDEGTLASQFANGFLSHGRRYADSALAGNDESGKAAFQDCENGFHLV